MHKYPTHSVVVQKVGVFVQILSATLFHSYLQLSQVDARSEDVREGEEVGHLKAELVQTREQLESTHGKMKVITNLLIVHNLVYIDKMFFMLVINVPYYRD